MSIIFIDYFCRQGNGCEVKMYISKINTLKSYGLNPKIRTFKTNPIYFGNCQKDSFEKQKEKQSETSGYLRKLFDIKTQIEKLKEEYKKYKQAKYTSKEEFDRNFETAEKIKEKIKELDNEEKELVKKIIPNSEFLLDDAINWKQRKEILKSRPEIVVLNENKKAQQDTSTKTTLYYSPYFLITKTGAKNFLDLSFETNKSNYETLMKDSTLSQKKLCDLYGFTFGEIQRYTKEGYLNKIQLKNCFTGEFEPIAMYDIEDSQNLNNGIKRKLQLRNMLPKPSKHIDKPYISIEYLASLGFGTKEEIEDSIKDKKIEPPIEIEAKTANNKTKTVRVINIKSRKNEGELKYLRNNNKKLAQINQFAQLAKTDIEDVENGLLSGEIENIGEYLFSEDKHLCLFDLKNPKNINFVIKKQIENLIIRLENKRKISTINKIIWKLSPSLEKASKKYCAMYPEIIEIFKKQDEITQYEEKVLKGEIKEDESIAPYLTKEEREKLNKFFKSVWIHSDYSEVKEARKKANAAYRQYKKEGIDAIEDKTIRKVIEEVLKNEES